MAKKISSKGLKGIINKGGIIEEIKKPKPKKPTDMSVKDAFAETLLMIRMMAENMASCFRSQNAAIKDIKIEMPEPKKEKRLKKRLKVHRNKKELIEFIDIEEL